MNAWPSPAGRLIQLVWKHRRVLVNTSRIEIRKRFAGSLAGSVWLFLYPLLLFLGYAFVFAGIMRTTVRGLSAVEYLVFLFSGLVPFLGISEALTLATPSLRQNMHLVRNVLIPLELIPIRSVLIALGGQLASSVLVLAFSAATQHVGLTVLWLPLQLLAQVLFCIGIGMVLALGALVLPDVVQIVGLGLTVLLFVSPIGYRPEDAPRWAAAVMALNPLQYFVRGYRACVFQEGASAWPLQTFASFAIGLTVFFLGAFFLERMREALLTDE